MDKKAYGVFIYTETGIKPLLKKDSDELLLFDTIQEIYYVKELIGKTFDVYEMKVLNIDQHQ